MILKSKRGPLAFHRLPNLARAPSVLCENVFASQYIYILFKKHFHFFFLSFPPSPQRVLGTCDRRHGSSPARGWTPSSTLASKSNSSALFRREGPLPPRSLAAPPPAFPCPPSRVHVLAWRPAAAERRLAGPRGWGGGAGRGTGMGGHVAPG